MLAWRLCVAASATATLLRRVVGLVAEQPRQADLQVFEELERLFMGDECVSLELVAMRLDQLAKVGDLGMLYFLNHQARSRCGETRQGRAGPWTSRALDEKWVHGVHRERLLDRIA